MFEVACRFDSILFTVLYNILQQCYQHGNIMFAWQLTAWYAVESLWCQTSREVMISESYCCHMY
jgi:hypothetical protein